MIVIMLTSGIALLLACSAFITYEVFAFRHELVENMTVLAETVGSNCAAAIDFNDVQTAEETLAALQADHNIVAAAVYTPDGEIFAIYQNPSTPALPPPPVRPAGYTFEGNMLKLYHPIEPDGHRIGTIFVASDLKPMTDRLIRYSGIVGLVFLASLLVVLALSSRIQRFVSDPIRHLAETARTVAREKDYTLRATKRSDDELGQLTDGFNDMLIEIQSRDKALRDARDHLEKRVDERTRELEAIHKQLLESSRQAGMAEIATNVLHNVGNVLNSLNVSTALVTDSVRKSRVTNLGKLVTMLDEHRSDLGSFLTSDPKGKQIPVYLTRLSESLLADQESTLRELDSLKANIEHINEIVAMQQSYARMSGLRQVVNIHDLVEDSLRMNEGALKRHDISLTRELEEVPPVNVEKHKILQILVNLVRNAKYACAESSRPDKRITIRVCKLESHIRITVADNGVGIAPENLTRIFNYGFTTRESGHGFGLHSGALAAKEMGGLLTAHSAGVDQGAVFTLELPYPGDNNHA